LLDVDEFPIVDFDDCLTNYDVLLGNKFVHQPSPGLLFQAITQCSAEENTNMKSLATLGDSFLKLAISSSLHYQYPFADTDELTAKKKEQVSNENLYRLAMKMNLQHYLYANKVIYAGKEANWIPPGFTVNEENAKRYSKQRDKQKPFADLIESLIGALLISTDYMTTIKFMKWLGLDVIPMNEQSKNQFLVIFYL
jgi:endoribonuclease Dicer